MAYFMYLNVQFTIKNKFNLIWNSHVWVLPKRYNILTFDKPYRQKNGASNMWWSDILGEYGTYLINSFWKKK